MFTLLRVVLLTLLSFPCACLANTLPYSYILSPRYSFFISIIQWQLALAFEFLQLQRLEIYKTPNTAGNRTPAPGPAPRLTPHTGRSPHSLVIYSRTQVDQVRSWVAGSKMPGEYSCETHVHWPFNTSLRAWGSGGRKGREGTRTPIEAQSCSLRSFQAPALGRPHCRLPGTFSSPLRRPQRPRSPQGPQPRAQTRGPAGTTEAAVRGVRTKGLAASGLSMLPATRDPGQVLGPHTPSSPPSAHLLRRGAG